MGKFVSVVVLSLGVSFISLGGDQTRTSASRAETTLHLLRTGQQTYRVDPSFVSLQQTTHSKKAVGLAALYSLLVPGLGELYADGFSSGKYFTIAEGALWLTFATFDVYGNSLQNDARALARARAGVHPAGKNDQFFIDIGNFNDVQEYNEKQLRDREPEKLYDPFAGYSWRWESDEIRSQYRAQRIDAETMFNNRKFVIAAVIINHVASAINAARSASSYNKSLDQSGDLKFGASVLGGLSHAHGVLLTVTKEF